MPYGGAGSGAQCTQPRGRQSQGAETLCQASEDRSALPRGPESLLLPLWKVATVALIPLSSGHRAGWSGLREKLS